jgi:hypothetical protein
VNRKIVLLNLTLAALAGTLVWQIRIHWRGARERERSMISQTARPPQSLPPPPLEAPKTVTPGDYLDVAQRTLFSRDRNPNVIVDVVPPPPPPPEKPLPQLPLYHGQMSLGKTVVVLSLKGDDQKSYEAGEEVGPFKLVAFDRESITLEWEGKTVERKLAELKPKEAPPAQQQETAAPAPAPSAAAVVKSIGSGAGSSSSSTTDAQPGQEIGGGFRACAPGDTSPEGTISGGYRKVVARGLMGASCHWEQVK